MLERKFVLCLALAAAVVGLSACQSGAGSGTGGGNSAGGDSAIDSAGELRMDGAVRIKSVERAPNGNVRYVLQNVSGKDQEDLAYFISFFYESGKDSAITKINDRETTPQRDLLMLRGAEREVSASNPNPGKRSLGTRIDIVNNEAVAVVARDANTPTGTLFLNRALECVGTSQPDEYSSRTSPPKLWIECENVSNAKISELEAEAIFFDPGAGDAKVFQTKWVPMHDLQPHARARIEFDLSTAPPLSMRHYFLVKIRQQSL